MVTEHIVVGLCLVVLVFICWGGFLGAFSSHENHRG